MVHKADAQVLQSSKPRFSAIKEAKTLLACKCDGIIVENMGDIPYQRPEQRGPETSTMMTGYSKNRLRGEHFGCAKVTSLTRLIDFTFNYDE